VPELAPPASFPLSSVQSTYFTTAHLPGGGTFHIGSSAIIFIGADPAVLVNILERTLERHAAFRTVFAVIKFRVTQTFDGPTPVVQQIDLRSASDAYAEVAKLLETEAEGRFDLRRGGPPIRVRLIRVEDDVTVVSIVAHHVITDFWSANIVFNEVCAGLAATFSSAVEKSRSMPSTFRDYLQTEADLVASEEGKRRLAFWRAELDGLPTNVALSAPTVPLRAEDVRSYWLPTLPHFEDRVLERARATRTSFFVVLLDAMARSLRKWTGQHDFVIGFMTANRRNERFHHTVGSFAEPQIVRIRLPEDEQAPTIEGVNTAFKRALTNAMPLREIALATGRTTLHDVLLNVVESPTARLKRVEEGAFPESSRSGPSKRASEIESRIRAQSPIGSAESVIVGDVEIRRLNNPMKSFGLTLSVFVSPHAIFGQFDGRLFDLNDVSARLSSYMEMLVLEPT
jgi:hypothetical protein